MKEYDLKEVSLFKDEVFKFYKKRLIGNVKSSDNLWLFNE